MEREGGREREGVSEQAEGEGEGVWGGRAKGESGGNERSEGERGRERAEGENRGREQRERTEGVRRMLYFFSYHFG